MISENQRGVATVELQKIAGGGLGIIVAGTKIGILRLSFLVIRSSVCPSVCLSIRNSVPLGDDTVSNLAL